MGTREVPTMVLHPMLGNVEWKLREGCTLFIGLNKGDETTGDDQLQFI